MKEPAFTSLGIDVGGTKIAAGCVTFPEVTPRFRRVIPSNPHRGGLAVLNDCLQLAESLMAEAQQAGLTVHAIGLGLCELVGTDGRVLSESTVRWMDLPVRERFSALAPFTLEADVRAAALAEARFGAGRELRVFLYVTVGTGISSCLIIDGKPFAGARGVTGTMASAALGWTCTQCSHVNMDSLEEIAAGPALVRAYNKRGTIPLSSGQEVLAAAAKGDEAALRIVQTAGEALGSVVGLLVNVLDPEAIVVGGGLGLSEGPYWESFCAATRRHTWSEVHRNLRIIRAETGADAGWLGAATTAWQRALTTSVQDQRLCP